MRADVGRARLSRGRIGGICRTSPGARAELRSPPPLQSTSPHTRGWCRAGRRGRLTARLLPAPAGMVPLCGLPI